MSKAIKRNIPLLLSGILISLIFLLCTSLKVHALEFPDMNNDGKIDILDLAETAKQYNLKANNVNWNSKYDQNNDSIVDIYDLVQISVSLNNNINIFDYTSANINNYSHITSDANWIYYISDSDGFLYKKSFDESVRTKICDDTALFINASNGWIYYRNDSDNGKLYKIKNDGTSRTKLNDDNVTYVYQINNIIYYINNSTDSGLYKINLDGSNRSKIASLTAASNSFISNLTFDGSWFYYIDGSDQSIYKIKLDGSQKTKLTNRKVSIFVKNSSYLYYTDLDYNKLYKIKTDGTGDTLFLDYKVISLNTKGNLIFYCYQDQDFTYKLSKMSTNGTERTIIDQENAALINIVGDWIYFINNSSYGLVYKIKVDGTSRNLQDSIDHKFVNANKFGNENSNILNESLSSYQDNWVYFADRYGLFRATVDGSQIYQITQGMIRNINVVGEWVYYTVSMPSYDESNWLYKVKIDGTERTQLNNGYCNNVLVYDDWIYYIDSREGGKFYRIKTDGSQKSLITTEEYYIGNFNIIDDWIYYTNNGSIYKMKIDGSQKQVILQHKNAYMVGINDNWVYYKTSEMNDKGLYRVSIDGQNNSKLFDLPGSNFIFKGDSIYFCDFSDSIGWYSIYKMNIDGTGRTLLINEPADKFSISGKWLFYFHNNSISYNSVYLGSV